MINDDDCVIILVYGHTGLLYFDVLLFLRHRIEFSLNLPVYPLISQEQYFSAAMRRRSVALLSAFSTAMLILSNLVFLGGGHVGRIFWKRVVIQGKCPSEALTQWDLCAPSFCGIVSTGSL